MNTQKTRQATVKLLSSALMALFSIVTLIGVSGCATSANQKDPIEGFNRAMFSINDSLDSAAIKPVAKAYDSSLPSPIKRGISNFFNNIEDAMVGVNNILQGKPAEGVSDLGRVLVNSTMGILGFIDVASEMGLEKHDEDFGQTMGRWGVGNGPYVVLPLFGPKTTRDAIGFAADSRFDPVGNIDHIPTRNSLTALRIVQARAELLSADKVVDEAALDKYSYIRDAYLQRRRNLIHDGNPPRDNAEE